METNSPFGDATLAADLLDDYDADPAPLDDCTLPPDRFLDRELSWLAFNQRVLELAEDPALPLLERANFLAIFATNLDEFFMVRVAGLKRRIDTGLAVPTNVGRAPLEVLGDNASYLLPEALIKVEFYDVEPVGIELPATVDLKVKETEPGIKGATASAQVKPATLETGLVVTVPAFIKEGDVIRISTETGEYLGRG